MTDGESITVIAIVGWVGFMLGFMLGAAWAARK